MSGTRKESRKLERTVGVESWSRKIVRSESKLGIRVEWKLRLRVPTYRNKTVAPSLLTNQILLSDEKEGNLGD